MIKDRLRRLEYAKAYQKWRYYTNLEESRTYTREYHRRNKDRLLQKERERRKADLSSNRALERKYSLKARTKTKVAILTNYGGGKCACAQCGENRIECLSLDHINNDGMEHRKRLGFGGYRFYRLLQSQGYPEGYQTLCINCQWVKKAENQRRRRKPLVV